MGFPGLSVVKNLPANARDVCLIPGLGRSPGEEMVTSILAWEIPWIEESDGLQSTGCRVRHDLENKQQQCHYIH